MSIVALLQIELERRLLVVTEYYLDKHDPNTYVPEVGCDERS